MCTAVCELCVICGLCWDTGATPADALGRVSGRGIRKDKGGAGRNGFKAGTQSSFNCYAKLLTNGQNIPTSGLSAVRCAQGAIRGSALSRATTAE